jgi:hypothetical protein
MRTLKKLRSTIQPGICNCLFALFFYLHPLIKNRAMSEVFCPGTFKILLLTLLLSTQGIKAQEYGLQLYSLRNQFTKDAATTMAKVKSMGFKDVEMAGTYGLPFPELMKLLAQNELNVVSFGADFERLERIRKVLSMKRGLMEQNT